MHIVAAGDCGIDRYVNLKADRAGGITLNFAINARQLLAPEHKITLVTAIGDDEGGPMVLDIAQKFQIPLAHQVQPGPTPIQFIDRHPNGEKHFTHYEVGVLGDYQLNASQRRRVADCDLLVMPYYREIDAFFRDVISTPSSGQRIVDFGALKSDRDRLAAVHEHLDALHMGFFGLNPTDKTLIDALEAIAVDQKKLFVVTLGEHGSVALGAKTRIHCAAEPVAHIEDTTGAGDTFLAAFLSQYQNQGDVSDALRAGAKAASVAISRVGAFDAPLIPWPSAN